MVRAAPRLALRCALFLWTCATTGCVQAQLFLAAESRLPRWFTLPPGVERSAVTVRLRTYAECCLQMRLQTTHGQVLAAVQAETETSVHQYEIGGPRTGDNLVDMYPSYRLVSVNGTQEVIEFQRVEPVFYVADDPEIIKKVKDAAAALNSK